jgi:hypothetical protein
MVKIKIDLMFIVYKGLKGKFIVICRKNKEY